MTEPEGLEIVWSTRECTYSNRANCEYLRINMTCKNTNNPNWGLENSCKKSYCPIKI